MAAKKDLVINQQKYLCYCKAIQRGTRANARQSSKTTICPSGLRGFPHERHRAYRLQVASQRWRGRAVQEAIS